MKRDLRPAVRALVMAVVSAAAASNGVAQGTPPLPAQRFDNWLFTAPDGWSRREDADGLLLTSSDGRASLRIVPGEQLSSAGLDTFLDGQLVLLEQGLTLETAEARATTPTGEHYEWMVWARALKDRQGRLFARTYFAANPRARAELLVFTALDWDTFKRSLPLLERFIESVQFANVRGVPKLPPRPLPPIAAPPADRASGEPAVDEFRCYVRSESDDYSSPDFLVQMLPGRQYRTADGTGAHRVIANPASRTGRVEWQSGPLATASPSAAASFGTVGWQDDGQLLLLANAPVGRKGAARDVACYQRGAREARAKEAFARLDPRPGSYPCAVQNRGTPAGTLVLLPGRRYRYDGGEGAYSVNIMDYQLEKVSLLKFHGGPFQYGSGTYGASQSARRSITISAAVSLECASTP